MAIGFARITICNGSKGAVLSKYSEKSAAYVIVLTWFRLFQGSGMVKNLFLVLMASVFALTGCATNPVTGKKELSFVGEDWELSVGKQQYSPSRQSQGGDYLADPQVQAYVNKVGQRLAAVSDRKLPYEFKVLNSGVPNAWALPGGKIAINRGLLTKMKSESELAAVLGHEIVHAAAKHGAKGMTRGVLLQGGLMAATIASSGKKYSDLAQMGASVGAQLINTRYGRDAERESDRFGIEYMARAGYDPQGAVDLQATFLELSKDSTRGKDFISGLFASHPPSEERLATNRAIVAKLPKGGETKVREYRQNIARLLQSEPAYEAFEEAQKAIQEKDLAKARSLTQRAISIEPREGHFHSLLGDLDNEQGNYASARRNYGKAIQLNNDFFYYHLQMGLVSEKARDFASAERSLTRSLELLPTANAYNALGNIARANGRREQAVAQYTKAAGHNSPAGKQALGSLVDLDLASNPGKYVVARHQVGSDGVVRVQLQNKTPRNIRNVALRIVYPDASGQMKDVTRTINGVLPAGKTEVLEVVRINPSFAKNVQSGVVGASVATR
jgi:predicted Zn-dependent protease